MKNYNVVNGAEINTSGDWSYKFLSKTDKLIAIVGYTGTEENLVIPSQIDGYTVYSIGYEVRNLSDVVIEQNTGIENNSYIKTVKIPDTVRKIENKAFYNCENLVKIDVPDGVKKVSATMNSKCGKNLQKKFLQI